MLWLIFVCFKYLFAKPRWVFFPERASGLPYNAHLCLLSSVGYQLFFFLYYFSGSFDCMDPKLLQVWIFMSYKYNIHEKLENDCLILGPENKVSNHDG